MKQVLLAQVELLQHLSEHPGARVGQVAADLHLAGNTVSTLVRQLVAAELLSRDRDASDRRAAALRVSPAGSAYLSSWQAVQQDVIAEGLAALPAAGQERLRAALPALAELATAIATAGTVAAGSPRPQTVGPPAT